MHAPRIALSALALGACNAIFEVDGLTLEESSAPTMEASCEDDLLNGDETGVDCGGTCPACASAGKPNGERCVDGAECASGHCPEQDGVCCDSACALICEACVEAKTGQADGVCDFVDPELDPDPDADCEPESPSTCGIGPDGCAGDLTACIRWPAGTTCVEAFCASGTAHTDSKCDTEGSCPAAQLTACTPFVCDTAGVGCLTSCRMQTDCIASHYCDSSGSCLIKKMSTAPCVDHFECQSGVCSTGLCA